MCAVGEGTDITEHDGHVDCVEAQLGPLHVDEVEWDWEEKPDDVAPSDNLVAASADGVHVLCKATPGDCLRGLVSRCS